MAAPKPGLSGRERRELRASSRAKAAEVVAAADFKARAGAHVEGRVDARQPWKPLLCGVGTAGEVSPKYGGRGCYEPAAVVLDGRLVELVSKGKLGPLYGKVGNVTEAPELARRIGLCVEHWQVARPGVALPSLGWGERLELSAGERLSVELGAAASSAAVEVEGGASDDGDGAAGAAAPSAKPGWSGGRRVARGRAAGAPVASEGKVERLGFLVDADAWLHGSDPGCARIEGAAKSRRLTHAEWASWGVLRCGCAGWFGTVPAPVEVEPSRGRKGGKRR